MKKITFSFLLTILLTFSVDSYSQIRIYHQLGGSVGPALISGDWGRNSNVGKVFGYDGFEVNVNHSMQIVRDRFGLKSSLGYMYTKQVHRKDEWTGDGLADPSEEQKKIAAMSGTSNIITLGTQLEYNFIDFGMYYPRNTWTPYVALGFNVLYYIPSVSTPLGVPSYLGDNGIYQDSGLTTSFKGSLGAKYRLSRFLHIYAELVAQRSFSDNIDGISHDSSKGTDYISNFNIGIMYYFR